MTNIKKNISFLFLFLIAQVALAQFGSQSKADYLFSQFAYAKAVPLYEKMVEADSNLDHAHQRLAECHLLMRDAKKALPHFEVVMFSSTPPPSDFYFKYAMALYSTGDKKGAEKWLKKYKKLNKNDSRVKKFLKNGSLASVVFNSRERYDVTPVAFNSEYSDFGAYEKDGYLYFASSRIDKGAETLYGWNDEPWLDIFTIPEDKPEAEPAPIKGNINSDYHESSMVFSTDYKNDTVIYFTRNSYYNKKKTLGLKDELNLKIFSAKKIDGEWEENRDLSINNDLFSTGHPCVTVDRKRIYFTSDRPGGYGGSDIYYAPIHDRGGIGKPVNAGPAINTEGNEMFPFINSEGQLFFASDGHVGFGQLDIFSSILNDENEIVDVINLGNPINTSADDFAYFEHEAGGSGYISSNRDGGTGSDDIYKFMFTPSLSIQGRVIDAVNLQPLDSVTVSVYDQITNTKVAELITGKDGEYKTFINRNSTYMIEAVRRTHPHKSIFVSTTATPRSTKTIEKDIMLEPVLDLKILADLNKIYFDFNKSDIRPDAAIELNKVVKLMTVTYPEMVIRLEAHTDPVGSHNYNDKLSERRAKSTYEYLIANGVPQTRILSYKGFGKRKTINGCTGKSDCNDEELELNRRTEFPIIQIKGNLSDIDSATSSNK
jgi:outer membrane protein OmpA-like peptidoglycan-associated protein/tetratricopeptide (TPR) repeat protein